MLKTHRGSCHCGAVTFEADLDLSQPTIRCNCSICRRHRQWNAVTKPAGFRLLTGESELVEYQFGPKVNEHHFCRHCGVRCFGVANETPRGKLYGINIGCLTDVSEEELDRIPITYFDGIHDRTARPEFFRYL